MPCPAQAAGEKGGWGMARGQALRPSLSMGLASRSSVLEATAWSCVGPGATSRSTRPLLGMFLDPHTCHHPGVSLCPEGRIH